MPQILDGVINLKIKDLIMYKIHGWHLRNRKKYLEELKDLKQQFPNHKLIEGYNQKRIIGGYFEVNVKKIYFKIIYPYHYPLENPKVYLLKNLEDLSEKLKLESEHLDQTDLSLCLFPSDDGSASWRIMYTAVDALGKLKELYQTKSDPESYIQEHSSEDYVFPGIPNEGTIFLADPLYEYIKNSKKIGKISLFSNKEETIYWAYKIEDKKISFDISEKSPWNYLITDKKMNKIAQYLYIDEKIEEFKEKSYEYPTFLKFLEKIYNFKRDSSISEVAIILGKNSVALYSFNEKDFNKRSNRLYFYPGKILKIPDSFFPRTIDFFNDAFKELSESKVLLIGLGSIGSTIAYQLVKTGIEELDFYDYDTLQPENISRHTGNISQLGKYKTEIMKENLKKINPNVFINSYPYDPFSGNHFNELKIRLRRNDLIIVSTGSLESEILINELAVNHKIPTLFCWCTGNVDLGGFFIYIPQEGPCYECFYNQREKVDRIINSTKRTPQSRLPGQEAYNSPGIPGISIDIDFIGLFAARLAIQILMRGSKSFKKYYPILSSNYFYWNNREIGNIMSFGPSSYKFTKLDDCPICAKTSKSIYSLNKEEEKELKKLEKEAFERDLS